MENKILYIGIGGILVSPLAYMITPLIGGFVLGVGTIFFIFSNGIEYELQKERKR